MNFATPRILGSGLGRTGLTGRRDRSDRYHGRLRGTGLTGRVAGLTGIAGLSRGKIGGC